jgi:alanyl-tRNA synthetase
MSQKLVDYRSQHSIPEPVVPRSMFVETHMLHQIENDDNSAMGVLRVEFNATRSDVRVTLSENEKLKAENEKLKAQNEKLMTDKVNLKDETMQLKADAATLKEEYKEYEARDVKRARLDDEKHSWSTTAIEFYRKEIDGVVAREARTVARLDEARAKMQELHAILDPSRRV